MNKREIPAPVLVATSAESCMSIVNSDAILIIPDASFRSGYELSSSPFITH